MLATDEDEGHEESGTVTRANSSYNLTGNDPALHVDGIIF